MKKDIILYIISALFLLYWGNFIKEQNEFNELVTQFTQISTELHEEQEIDVDALMSIVSAECFKCHGERSCLVCHEDMPNKRKGNYRPVNNNPLKWR